MAGGIKRAKIAALRTQQWTVQGEILTGEQVVAVFSRIDTRYQDRAALLAACGETEGMSGRRIGRALQILRKTGLIRYDRTRRTWYTTHSPGEP